MNRGKTPPMLRLVHSGDDESPVVLPRSNTAAATPALTPPATKPAIGPAPFGRTGPTGGRHGMQVVHPRSLVDAAAVSGPLAVAFDRAAAAAQTAKPAQPAKPAAPRQNLLRVERRQADTRTPTPAPSASPLRFDGRSVERERMARQDATAAVTRENRVAARLSYDDPRWIFAVRVVQSLEGGQAAILGPSGRRSLVKSAATIGLRPFDANLLIAIVQDEVRQGGTGLSHSAQSRMNLIREADPVAGRTPIWPAVVMALAIAGVLALVMMEWVVSAAR